MKSRKSVRILLTALAVVVGIVSIAAPASAADSHQPTGVVHALKKEAIVHPAANSYYPSGCDSFFYQPWSDNACWLGQYYVNLGTSVIGIQYLVNALGYNAGTPDCEFGSNTDAAVIRYQQANGLTADGIAGPVTLYNMESHLSFSGVIENNTYYWNIGYDGLRYGYYSGLAWMVLTPHAGYVGMSGGYLPSWCS